MAKFSRSRQLGNMGEDVACRYLESKGYKVLERNYLRFLGEIDIVAEKAGTVRFIEVKAISRENPEDVTRESNDYRPEEQVHPEKLRKLALMGEMYMNEKGDDREYQIDVVGVYLNSNKGVAICRLFEQVL